jgi:UDP-glucose 4-epimerase
MWLLHCQEQPRKALDVNVVGAVNVAEACVRQGVGRLVFSSSAAVYGPAETIPVEEDDPLRATTVYGATKIAAEALLRACQARDGLALAALRYFNVYGPRQAWNGPYVSVIMKMLNAIEAGDGPTIVGDGTEALDLVAVEDCARANLTAMRSDRPHGVYNVATGRGNTLRELAETLLDLTGSDLPIRQAPATAQSGRGLVGSPDRAEREIGFRAELGVREGLQRLIDWRSAQKTGG